MLITKRTLTALCCAVVMAGASVAPVFAGEITGNGKPTAGPDNANSICVFSGKNDDPNAPLSLDFTIAPNGPGGPSQSYGQDVKIAKATIPNFSPSDFNPGDACRGGSNEERQR